MTDKFITLLYLLPVCYSIQVRYIVLSPRVVRPGMVYSVVTRLMCDDLQLVSVYASIIRDTEVTAEASMEVPVNAISTIPIQVATNVLPGAYKLNFEVRSKGVILFSNSSELVFDPRFLSIVVQTSRPLYRAGQEVRFRVVALHMDLRPFNDGLEIYIIDPDGFIMRRWISAYTNNGVASLSFHLPKLSKDGYWKIRIKALNQIVEQAILVETYFDPLFEVHVQLPTYVVESEDHIEGKVFGMFTSQRLVKGNGTLTLSARYWRNNHTFTPLWADHVFFKANEHMVNIPLELITSKMGSTAGVELKLHATITDMMSGETVEGFSHTRLVAGQVRLAFLSQSPAVFKPGLTFYTHVAVMYEDNEKLPSEILSTARLRIQVSLELESGHTKKLPDLVAGKGYQNVWIVEDNIVQTNDIDKEMFVEKVDHDLYLEEGVLKFSFDTTDTTRKIMIKAEFITEDGISVKSYLEARPYFSPKKRFLAVMSSSTNLAVDEYAIFHIKSNFIMDSFQYLVVAKNSIVTSGDHVITNSSLSATTLSLSLSSEMAPGFTFLVFHITSDGQILADSCFLPVDGFSKYNTELEINTGKDHKSERVEVRASGGVGAFIGVHAVRGSIYRMQAGNEISLARITEQFMLFDNTNRRFNKLLWRSRDGVSADQVVFLMSMDYGFDTNSTIRLAGLNIFSSENVLENPGLGFCNSADEIPCDLSSCYPANKTCDGVLDCDNGHDEQSCPHADKEDHVYKMFRTSRNEFSFDLKEADWGWREIKVNDHEGVEFEPLAAPSTGDDWYFSTFSINTDLGFSIIPEPVIFSSKRNLMMHVSGPSSCYTGEQISLQVDLINNHDVETLVLVTLKGSSDYLFVNVEEGGIVSSYSARLTSGDHQLLVYMKPESQEHIDFPVTPTVEQGAIEITIIGAAQTGQIIRTHNVLVQGGGALINKHTSVFLDLKSRALVMAYLDIIVEETPIIPYNLTRRYVFGSTSASVEVFGDIIGSVFSSVPATMESTLKTSSKGTLARVFEFGMNIWSLHYLRLTNKLQRPFLKEVLLECNTIYAQIIKRFHPNGSFKNWDSSEFSVWLTAWTLRLLKAATYPDWEFLLFVDPSIIEKGIRWLLHYQAPNGSFYDSTAPLDSKMNIIRTDVTLTAHVLITLCDCLSAVSGEVKTQAAVASQRAAAYLERQLSSLRDPHLLAVTVYALAVSMGQGDIEHGYLALLRSSRQNSEGFVYWSSMEIPANPIKKENQRPYVKPRLYHESDSLAVETTAWVLLISLHREGVTERSEKIVQWLNSVRMTSGGFITTVDSLVALQALTEYAFRARLHEITDMDVMLELPMSGNLRHKVHIDKSSVLFQKQFEIPRVWGNVLVRAQGAGQAVVQMDVNYGVDHESLVEFPTVPSFDLNITEYYSTHRNKSALIIKACFRWVRDIPKASSAATLEIDTPTGYRLVESAAENIASRGSHPTLRDGLVTERKTIWFFEQVKQDWSCFNFTLKRWYPVANMSLHRQALLYETTARERFVQVLFNSTPLHVLNICEVCGSYQCPYCPNYNAAASAFASLSLITLYVFIQVYKYFVPFLC